MRIDAVEGVGEIEAGADLGALLTRLDLRDGDVVVVTSKIVSKAEGRSLAGTRDDALPGETVRVVARRGPTSIVENPLGLVMAAAGIDASNVAPGTVLLLPLDPDGTARSLRTRVHLDTGVNLGVIVSDTAGRAWRTGQTDIAIGCAGIAPLDTGFAGRMDAYGNPLAVTAPAVADEIAGAAELVTGKLGGRPLSVVRGLAERVLPPGEHGPGACSLVRPRAEDLFALGAREAVVAAVAGRDGDCFGAPAPASDLVAALGSCGITAVAEQGAVLVDAAEAARSGLVAFAHGWTADGSAGSPGRAAFAPRLP